MLCIIIAECGVNHDGKLDKALSLCEVAKQAGADVAKTQTFIPEKLLRPGNPRMDFAKSLVLSFPDTLKIARHCEAIGIEFCSTPDDLDSLKFLVEECGVKRIKIGSGSLLYRPLVDAAFDTGLPVLLSTGMATQFEVDSVVMRQLERFECRNDRSDITLMHCVSLYSCPLNLANVKAMLKLTGWGMPVGYSDHTIGDYAVCAAVALGAAVIEKHFTLDNEAEGPDHRMSAMPEQFATMVQKIRMTEVVLGHGRKEPSEEEAAMIVRVRKDNEGYQAGI